MVENGLDPYQCIRPEFTENFTRSQNKLRRAPGPPPSNPIFGINGLESIAQGDRVYEPLQSHDVFGIDFLYEIRILHIASATCDRDPALISARE